MAPPNWSPSSLAPLLFMLCVPSALADSASTTTTTITTTITPTAEMLPSRPTGTIVFQSLEQIEACARELQAGMCPECCCM
ncbi:hypothetical protein N7509_000707 [Penicillium cosmopolitanum]|uniref:Uncharacterized protein n=1 Tax=Penicillium cosmopolitanum TaxID=1131564 RepID=A0A9X0BEF9_9EURO|nr:uncharacterized protein N7509_000707 [Penicillium cosmopolitanum]KAJ5414080.1 hypothetical protein N7509_000707 [Penicillium cosmopolitanum]